MGEGKDENKGEGTAPTSSDATGRLMMAMYIILPLMAVLLILWYTDSLKWMVPEGYLSRNTTYLGCGCACGAYDMVNMDQYSVMGPLSSAMTAPPCSVADHIHESLAYDCYVKPDDFLKRLDAAYQPHGKDGIGVLTNSVAWQH